MTTRPARELIAGVDEAGRGPLAGPVVAAAVILDPARPIAGLNDSKKLTAAAREALAATIRREALAWAVAGADAAEIDRLNIFHATFLAMRRALLGLRTWPAAAEVDGKFLPDLEFGCGTLAGRAVIGGDASVPAISAASILAKTVRDDIMRRYDRAFPQYGFARHKGYPTAAHREQIALHGPCPQHRLSFRLLRKSA